MCRVFCNSIVRLVVLGLPSNAGATPFYEVESQPDHRWRMSKFGRLCQFSDTSGCSVAARISAEVGSCFLTNHDKTYAR